MNPETNRFEPLIGLLRPDGTPVPDHWAIFKVDEILIIKSYRFKILHIGTDTMLLEPVGPIIIGESSHG